MEVKGIRFEKNFNIWTVIAPYYGYVHEWYYLTTSLCTKSRSLIMDQEGQFMVATHKYRKSISISQIYSRLKKFYNPWEKFPLFLYRIRIFTCKPDLDSIRLLVNYLKHQEAVMTKVKNFKKVDKSTDFICHNRNTTWDHQLIIQFKDQLFSVIKNFTIPVYIYKYLQVSVNLSEASLHVVQGDGGDDDEEDRIPVELDAYFNSLTTQVFHKEEEKKMAPKLNVILFNTDYKRIKALSKFLATKTAHIQIQELTMIISDSEMKDLKIAQESAYCESKYSNNLIANSNIDSLERLTVITTFEGIHNLKKMAKRIQFNELIMNNNELVYIDLSMLQILKRAKLLTLNACALNYYSNDFLIFNYEDCTFQIYDARINQTIEFYCKKLKILSDDTIALSDQIENATKEKIKTNQKYVFNISKLSIKQIINIHLEEAKMISVSILMNNILEFIIFNLDNN